MIMLLLGALLVFQFVVLVALGHEVRTRREQIIKLAEAIQQAGVALQNQQHLIAQMNTLDTLLAKALKDVQKRLKVEALAEDNSPRPADSQLH